MRGGAGSLYGRSISGNLLLGQTDSRFMAGARTRRPARKAAQPQPVERGSRVVLTDHIEHSIVMIRGHKVLLDSDLAALYGVSVKRLNEQVKRNPARFPPDFAFQLTREEYEILRSQSATLKASQFFSRWSQFATTSKNSQLSHCNSHAPKITIQITV